MKKYRVLFASTSIVLLALLASGLLLATRTSAHASPAHGPQSFKPKGPAIFTAVTGPFKYSCPGASAGNLVISITEKVTNDADSGLTNYWALDTYTRTIKLWNTGPDSYCGIVAYSGTFKAQSGQQSPGSTSQTGGILTGDEGGTWTGQIQDTITGQLDITAPSTWPIRGKVNGGNAVDYGCTGFTPQTFDISCPGYVNWIAQYFAPGYTLNEPQWGFKYVGKDQPPAPDAGTSDGIWIDAATGVSGDILDVD